MTPSERRASGGRGPGPAGVDRVDVRRGESVLLNQDEIDAAAGERSHVIELEEFVCAREIDPDCYDSTYYLGAGDDGEAAYRLLHDALERSGRAGMPRPRS